MTHPRGELRVIVLEVIRVIYRTFCIARLEQGYCTKVL